MHLWEISLLTVSGECSLSGPGKAMLKIVQYSARSLVHALRARCELCCHVSVRGLLQACVSVSLDLSGSDFLEVDVVAATVDLVVLHVPVLQLQTQLPHHSLEVPVPAVHLDVVLLQLLLVADHLNGVRYSE